jgi:hypothetical protein
VSDLPAHLDVADTDKVGRLYNVMRKELGFLPNESGLNFEERMSIEDFRGLFSGETVTKGMFEECQLVNSIYADVASRIVEREEEIKLQLANAQALWDAMRKCEDKEQRRSAVLARNKARSVQLAPPVCALLGAGQAGESQGMGTGDEHHRLEWYRLRGGSLSILPAGNRQCLCRGNRRTAREG